MKKFFTLIIFLISILLSSSAQHSYSDSSFRKYPVFIPDQNTFHFYNDSSVFTQLLEKYSNVLLSGSGKINVVHFGGSHIQADIYSHVMRQHLQEFDFGLNGGRGFVFPFRIAGTNNPSNYGVSYTGDWKSCRNVETKKDCSLGVAGISIFTSDTTATITLTPNAGNRVYYDFNKVRIFHNQGSLILKPVPRYSGKYFTETDTLKGITTFFFESHIDTLHFSLQPEDSLNTTFEFYGMTLENDDPGVVYHSFGVNGASFPSFLRCNLFVPQLKALDPDLAIVSIGTNDAYTRHFDPAEYEKNYREFIENLRSANPDIAVLLTVPNDSYLYRRYENKNTQLMEEVILKLAKEYGYGVWDFYALMGGLGSCRRWENAGLMQRDKIHFTRKGYALKGDLFYQAFVQMFDNYAESRNISILLNRYMISVP